jgi:hypothetical protein
MSFDMRKHFDALNDEDRRRIAPVLARIRVLQMRNGMMPRNDSRLTWRFCTGELSDLTEADIAKELVAVDFVHTQTAYGDMLPAVMRHVAADVAATYGLDWTRTWGIVREYVPDMMKLFCLERSGKQIPPFEY